MQGTRGGDAARLGSDSDVQHSILRWVRAGKGCRIVGSVVEGAADCPVVLGDRVTVINSHVRSTGVRSPFKFAGFEVDERRTIIGDDVSVLHSSVLNSVLDRGAQILGGSLESCRIGESTLLRSFADVSRSAIAPSSNIGSETSKSLILGTGFVSEHHSSYLSLLAPGEYPVLMPDGREEVLMDLPNATNIGAGTVFANYGGDPIGEEGTSEISESLKGTAVVYSSFVCVNCRVVNRYGQPAGKPSPFDLLRNPDLTILGLGSFVENKVTGRVPAFAYASNTSASSHRLGWTLEHKPGVILNIVRKMKALLGPRAGALQHLIEGTLRLEAALLREELQGRTKSRYATTQLDSGLAILERHLADGRWSMDDKGDWHRSWVFDQGCWVARP